MYSFNQILERIEQEVKDLKFENPPKSLYEPIHYILSLGGKRIRPALTLMACNLYSESIEKAITSALALEVFHNFTLLHDDLMDRADKRRNKPTVHKVWNDNAAILSGDAMLIASYELIGRTSDKLPELLSLFTKTAAEICGGQQYDMEFEMRNDVTVDEYIEMIRLKTAVLLGCALKTGALIGGAEKDDCQKLYDFGINIGLAFQLQDDLLDIYGDTAKFGKNIGGDILCNKKTFFLTNALQKASQSQLDELNEWLKKTEYIPDEKIQAVTKIYNDLHLKEYTEECIKQYFDKGMRLLNELSIEREKCIVITDAVSKLMNRQS